MTDEIDLWSEMIEISNRKTIVINEGKQEIIDSENFFGRPVLGKIVVLPMSSAEQFKYEKPWACISVFDSVLPVPPKIDENNCKKLLRLKFDDIEFKRIGTKLVEFSDSQALEVLDFANKMWNQIDLLMVHCAAGISRSTAIAKIISEIYQPEYAKYYSQLYSPNNLVIETFHKNMSWCVRSVSNSNKISWYVENAGLDCWVDNQKEATIYSKEIASSMATSMNNSLGRGTYSAQIKLGEK
jgi:predicted protein tyrosine phosphatase